MKKMPCLFVRVFKGKGNFEITREVTPGCEWVLEGEGTASIKWDGTACMVKDGVLYTRYDYKKKAKDKGKMPPEGWVACQDEPDAVTGHWPGWVPVDGNPQYKWHQPHVEAVKTMEDGTYELCGPHFQSNPEGLETDTLIRHGAAHVLVPKRDFDGIRDFVCNDAFDHEGIVFKNGDRFCKIRKSDFGLKRKNKN